MFRQSQMRYLALRLRRIMPRARQGGDIDLRLIRNDLRHHAFAYIFAARLGKSRLLLRIFTRPAQRIASICPWRGARDTAKGEIKVRKCRKAAAKGDVV